MKVYVLQYHDVEASYFVSVWSTPELAEIAKEMKNSTRHSYNKYDWDEVEVDTDPTE